MFTRICFYYKNNYICQWIHVLFTRKFMKTVENVYSVKILTKVETSQNVSVYTSGKTQKRIQKHMSGIGSRGQKKMKTCLCDYPAFKDHFVISNEFTVTNP